MYSVMLLRGIFLEVISPISSDPGRECILNLTACRWNRLSPMPRRTASRNASPLERILKATRKSDEEARTARGPLMAANGRHQEAGVEFTST